VKPVSEREAEASACAKAILIGEHAVVYGRPGIAVPLPSRRATARLLAGNPRGAGVLVEAPDLGKSGFEDEDPALRPLALAVEIAFGALGIPVPALMLRIESEVPVSRGLGSGAAVAAATVRACAAFAGAEFAPEEVSALAFEVEKLHHGKPSGIDNSVVAFERPVWFSRSEGPRVLPSKPFVLVLADSGVRAKTSGLVAGVARRREADPDAAEGIFDRMAERAEAARRALAEGDTEALGRGLDEAHGLLRELGVSCPALDRLAGAARAAGALGAKLSGAGGGGYLLALAPSRQAAGGIADALARAGGQGIFVSEIR
jgi:mevalonate kinase